MEAALVALKAIPLISGGSAAAAGAASSGLSTLSAILGIGGGLYSALYQRNVAQNAAAILEDNASRARFASQVEAQDSDINAAAAMADEVSSRAFSGFASDSPSYQRADMRNRVMARRDAQRIRQGGDLEASQYEAQALEKKAEAKNIGITAMFDAIGGAIDMRSSMISDASLVSKRKTNQVNRIKV